VIFLDNYIKQFDDEVKVNGICNHREPVLVEAGITAISDIPSEWSAERFEPFRHSR
jgi:hypothetical protein